jgi:hypothetical protein
MSAESEVYEDFVFPLSGSVDIKTLEDIFRSVGGVSSPVNMKYIRSITVQPFGISFV